MDKQAVVDKLKDIKKKPINPQKADLKENSNGTNYKGLMRYNAILDNILIGAHTQKTVELNGVEWTIRILTAKEHNNIRKEIMRQAKADECFEDFNLSYLEMTKIIAACLSP